MSKNVAHKNTLVQFFKHCTQYGTVELRLDDGKIWYGTRGHTLKELITLGEESLEDGMRRVATAAVNNKLEVIRASLSEYSSLEASLVEAADALASNGTSVDKDYGKDE